MIGKEWYSLGEVVPTVNQLTTFVYPNLDELRNGTWPTDPRPTGYVGRSRSHSNKAPWENAAVLAATIDERMDRIVDSIVLILYYTDPRGEGHNPDWQKDLFKGKITNDRIPYYTLAKIARELHYHNETELWEEMKLMLGYIRGRDTKTDSYPQWKAVRKCRQNERYYLSKGLPKS